MTLRSVQYDFQQCNMKHIALGNNVATGYNYTCTNNPVKSGKSSIISLDYDVNWQCTASISMTMDLFADCKCLVAATRRYLMLQLEAVSKAYSWFM